MTDLDEPQRLPPVDLDQQDQQSQRDDFIRTSPLPQRPTQILPWEQEVQDDNDVHLPERMQAQNTAGELHQY